MRENVSSEQADKLVDVVHPTPHSGPLLACKECGVLLWDIALHFRRDHPLAARMVLGPSTRRS